MVVVVADAVSVVPEDLSASTNKFEADVTSVGVANYVTILVDVSTVSTVKVIRRANMVYVAYDVTIVVDLIVVSINETNAGVSSVPETGSAHTDVSEYNAFLVEE